MNNPSLAVLYPGQGAYYTGVLSEIYRKNAGVQEVFKDIDAVAEDTLGLSVTGYIWGDKPASIETMLNTNPDVLQFSMYGISVAVFRLLQEHGLQPDLLVGHSFGEIAALVCGGAFSARQGAEIVGQRVKALKELENSGGYMAALGTDAHRSSKILDLIDSQKASVAVENYPAQTVISGAKDIMDAIAELCKILQISFIRLNSPLPFHSPLMQPAVTTFAGGLQHLKQQPLKIPVYSPILGRFYEDSDNLTDCLAEHLVRPVKFQESIRRLHSEGTQFFLECGALDTLCKIVKRILKEAEPVTVATLYPRVGDEKSIMNSINTLKTYDRLVDKDAARSGENLLVDSALKNSFESMLPELTRFSFETFWKERGSQIIGYAIEVYEDFLASQRQERRVETREEPQVPAVEPVKTHQPAVNKVSREQLYRELVEMYATALEYPSEVFTEEVELEAELGIDSVKQTELLARVSERYNLPPRPADFKMSEYYTMGRIVDFVFRLQEDAGSAPVPTPVEAPIPAPSPAIVVSSNGKASREQLYRELVEMYATALEYPSEVFTEEVELEAELGIDSVKQTELLARVSERYNLPPRPADFKMSEYYTMGRIVDFVYQLHGETPSLVAAR
jgi:acyl transferase domain-containing protein